MAVELLQTGAVERTVRLDPRTKLVLLVSVSTALLVGGSGPVMDAARVLMLLAPFALLAVSGRIGAAAGLLVAYAASWSLTALAVPLVEGPLNFAIVASCMIASRFLPTIATAYFVFATTTVSEFGSRARTCAAMAGHPAVGAVPLLPHPRRGGARRGLRYAHAQRGWARLVRYRSWSTAWCRSSRAPCR